MSDKMADSGGSGYGILGHAFPAEVGDLARRTFGVLFQRAAQLRPWHGAMKTESRGRRWICCGEALRWPLSPSWGA
jgi:hypothetical protein